MAIQLAQSHGPSWKRTSAPSAFSSCSRSGGLTPRNWTIARPPRMAAICAESDFTKVARNPSRYGSPGWPYRGFRFPRMCDPRTCSTKAKGPVPSMWVSYQRGSWRSRSAL